MPYWISQAIVFLPPFLWICFGVGIPLALAVLPRRDWRDRAQVAAVGMILGPAALTAWMFMLGMWGALQAGQGLDGRVITLPNVVIGTLAVAFIGGLLAWRKRNEPTTDNDEPRREFDIWLIASLVGAALVVRWLVISFWPFTAYDALWVYGYQGRLYTLLGYIPDSIDYYPQFMQLQYTFGQLFAGGIDDHAARAGLILLHLAAILAVYTLGSRLINRRTGLIAAGIWALYPHVGEWSRAGDLEILLANLFTLAAAFFLRAWFGEAPRLRYAALGGLMLGIGMWTKPTMGAFIWGVALLGLLELVRVRFNWRTALPRIQVIVVTGLFSIPFGAVWYVRNILLGHAPIDFPPDFWLTQAERSGNEFGWIIVSVIVLVAWLYLSPQPRRPDTRLVVGGVALVAAGVVPSILSPRPMIWLEFAALIGGLGLLALALIPFARQFWTSSQRQTAVRVGWALGLALPYFVTWFYSYSYHYRLSFAIVPLLILPTAAVLAEWTRTARGSARVVWRVTVILLALPGIVSAVYDVNEGWDYLWTDAMPDDTARYRSGNAALMNVVDGLQIWKDEHPSEELRISAPRVDRLPFFFPADSVNVDDAFTQLSDLDGMAYLVYGAPESVGAYQTINPLENQVVGALGRRDIIRRAWGLDDGIFRYDVYELNLAGRFTRPQPNGPAEGDVVFGGFARYLGYDIGGLEFWDGRRLVFHLYWEVLAPADDDYMTFVHLISADGQLVETWDGPVAPFGSTYYSTLMWEPGEFIADQRVLSVDAADLPEGRFPDAIGYQIFVGLYNFQTNARVPLTIDGEPAGDTLLIENRIALQAQPPD